MQQPGRVRDPEGHLQQTSPTIGRRDLEQAARTPALHYLEAPIPITCRSWQQIPVATPSMPKNAKYLPIDSYVPLRRDRELYL
jgi:hypothetical protein